MPHFKKNTQMKTTRFRTLFICLLLLLCRPLSAGTLDTFFAYLEQHTLQSEFTITVSEEVAQPMNYPGEITMLGRQFLLTMFDTEAAYDGQTLSVYSASTDELTLSTPTEAELLEANPFLYAQALVKVCTITEHPSKDRTQTIITLTPNDQIYRHSALYSPSKNLGDYTKYADYEQSENYGKYNSVSSVECRDKGRQEVNHADPKTAPLPPYSAPVLFRPPRCLPKRSPLKEKHPFVIHNS